MNYVDPTGHCPWCIGAAIGAVVGGAIGAWHSYATTGSVDWREVAAGAVGGALVGSGVGLLAELVAAPGAVMAANATIVEGAAGLSAESLAVDLSVATAEGQAVFWSGAGSYEVATQYALENGLTTIEMTPGGQYLASLGAAATREAWAALSAEFAAGASGLVTAILNNPSPTSTFITVELPILLNNNPAVTGIVQLP